MSTTLLADAQGACDGATGPSCALQAEPYCRTLLFYDHVAPQKPHAHRFIELLLSLDGKQVVIDYDGELVSAAGHVVPPLRRHAIVQCGAVARLYVAIGLRRAVSLRAIALVRDDEGGLSKALLPLRTQPASETSDQITLAWERDWLPGFDLVPRIEARIQRALRYIDIRRDPATTRLVLSASIGLSQSRFAALFLQEMGMPLGRYIIWRRILIALEYLKAGKTTTQAAIYAGFSDAPHLCRCYRGTFGSPPSLLPVGRIIQHGAGLEALASF